MIIHVSPAPPKLYIPGCITKREVGTASSVQCTDRVPRQKLREQLLSNSTYLQTVGTGARLAQQPQMVGAFGSLNLLFATLASPVGSFTNNYCRIAIHRALRCCTQTRLVRAIEPSAPFSFLNPHPIGDDPAIENLSEYN